MKKVSMMAVVVSVALSACTAQAPKANLKTDIDSLSYAAGLSQTQGLKDYLARMEVDTTHMQDFVKGLNEGSSIDKSDKKKAAHMMGVQIGQQISGQMISGMNQELFGEDSTQSISKSNFMAGFIGGVLNQDLKMSPEEAASFSQTKMEEIKNKQMEKEYGANKQEGLAFLDKNKSEEGVVSLPSGLQYKIVTKGTGPVPSAENTVKVHYKGTLVNGEEFDSSHSRGEPTEFMASQVIPGWTEALTLMPTGSTWMLYIPENLAYGSRDQGQIKPYSTLIFEVELISFK